ncbi:MAG: PAS domain S-box protein [Syntrophales bacterium]|nr:PAS domain S-box protein [Syntrophales bacterium]
MKNEAKTKEQPIEDLAALRDRRTGEAIEHYDDTGTAVNALLHLSLEDYSLEELLQKALDIILSVPSLSVETKGCIFLVEDEPDVLIQKVQKGLAEPLLKECARVPFSKCLCGRAASTKRIEFADHIDERHEVSYEGIAPHGHYCVPILLSGNTIGVINLYLKDGHNCIGREEEFLDSVANTLAGIIKRRRAEEEQRRHREAAERLAVEMAIIAEIGLVVSSTMNIEEVYERFAGEVHKIIPFDRIVINSINVEMNTGMTVYMAGQGIADRKVGVSYPLKGTGSFEMVRIKSSLLIQAEDFDEYKDRLPGLLSTFQAGFRSIMNIPLFSKGEIIGSLLLRSFNHAYTDQDVRLAERVGNQIAGSIANAELFADLKKTEMSLRESEGRYRAIVERAAVGVAEVEMRTGRFLTVNRWLCELVGRTEEELLATTFQAITYPDDLHVHEDKTAQLAAGEISDYGLEKRYIRKDGTIIWVNLAISPLWKPGEAPTSNLIVVQDINERRRAEVELLTAHAKLALLINSISSILIAVSEEDRIVFWNTEAEKQFGITEKQILGKPLRELGIKWNWDQIMEGITRCRRENNGVGLDNVKFLQLNGKEGILGLRITPTFGEKSVGMVTLIQGANITRRKIMENQLIQAQKLESIGQLAAGIAHEINTPTQYIGDNVRFLQTSCEALKKVLMTYEALTERIREGKACDDLLGEVEDMVQEVDLGYLTEEIPRAFQQTLEGVERVSRIVQSMKAFAHPGTEEKVPVDINKAIENTMMVARNEWKYVADLVTDFDPSLPLVSCVPGDINQVILNVLVNAAQAVSEAVNGGSGGKGKISISTRQDDSWVEIRISDTGNGIPVGIRPRIFDPFFTTKEVGKGSGQGLAISHTAIVERHHGTIMFDTEIGQGTTFIIRLPIKEPMNAGN